VLKEHEAPRCGSCCHKNGGPAVKRDPSRISARAVAHLQAALGLSERRACSLVGARTMVRYRSCRPADTELRGRLRELANERRRFGYNRRDDLCLCVIGRLGGVRHRSIAVSSPIK
jgi:hypothetical protein